MPGHNGESSRIGAFREQIKADAQDKTEKCEYCFLFNKLCDRAEPKCSVCVKSSRNCIPQKIAPKHSVAHKNTQDPWKKCQACAGTKTKCVYTGTSLKCTSCEKKKLQCVEQFRPVWRQIRRHNAQPLEQKCRACFEGRSFCDQKKPMCGRCAKYKYHCVPRGTPRRKPVDPDDKCRRCRQIKRACSHTLPCDWCKKQGIVCGPSLNEEAFAREGEAEDARRREREAREAGDGK